MRTEIPITQREKLVRGIYASLDEAIADRLIRLRVEEGLRPTCGPGCDQCCRHYVIANMAEAHTLVQSIKREWSADEISALQGRTRQWHAWDNSRPGRPAPRPEPHPIDLSGYEPCCPLLVNNRCRVYAVRPVLCRAHFVSTPANYCRTVDYPELAGGTPLKLASVAAAADPFSQTIRRHLEEAGWNYDRTLMLLPHWLAIEMGWDFGITL